MRIHKILYLWLTGNGLSLNTYFIILYILIQPSFSRAQTIHGRITSADNNEILAGVTVLADDTIGIASDSMGNYRLSLSPGQHTIQYSMISFQPTKKVILVTNTDIELNVRLNSTQQLLQPIVISAGKFEQRIEDVTVSMEVLKPDLVEKRNTVTMEDAADYIPGVSIIDGQANIRGGSGWSYGAGSRVQILVDDLPQLTADASDTKWTFLPVENLEQVEVLKGASSVLFGSSALNGVINFRTTYARDQPVTKVNAFSAMYDKAYITNDKKYSLNFRDHQTFYYGVNFLHSRKIKKLELVASGNFFRDEGYRQEENEIRGKISLNTRYNFNMKGLSAALNVSHIETDGDLFFLWKNDTTGAYIPAPNTISAYKTYRTSIDPSLTYVSKKGSSHKLRTRWFNATNTNNTNQYSRSDVYYSEYQFQKRFKDSLMLTTGAVVTPMTVTSETYGNHDGTQVAFYAQGDFTIHRLTVSGGGRVEGNEVDTIMDDWRPVFRSGINYRLFENTHLRASAGQGYRFPSIAERFIQTNVGALTIFPNPDLEPEKGISYEVGIRQGYLIGGWKGSFDLAFFENNYENMMEFVFGQWVPGGSAGFKSINVGKTRIRGIEVSATGEIKTPGGVTISSMIGYTLLDPTQLTYDSLYIKKIGYANYLGSDSSDFLKYRSSHMLKADGEIGYGKFAIGTSVRFTSAIINIDKIFVGLIDNLFPPGLGIGDYRKYHNQGDVVIDTRLSYQINKKLQAFFIVKNITNHIYMQRPADMQPPRSFVLQASLKL